MGMIDWLQEEWRLWFGGIPAPEEDETPHRGGGHYQGKEADQLKKLSN